MKNNSEKKESESKRLYELLCEHKLKITKETLDYLNTLDRDLIIQTNTGLTDEGEKYYEMINR